MLFLILASFLSSPIPTLTSLGDIFRYKYLTRNSFNESFSSDVLISLLWENIDKSYYQTGVSRLYELKITNANTNFLNEPLYFHSYDNQISPVIVSQKDNNWEVQIKKAVASLFQLTHHNMTERDTHHDCSVRYIMKSKDLFIKSKICHHPAFSDYSIDKGLLPSLNMRTVSKSRYKLDAGSYFVKNVDSLSRTVITSSFLPHLKFVDCTARQKLTLIKVEQMNANKVIYADNLNQALFTLNPKYTVEYQTETLKFNPFIMQETFLEYEAKLVQAQFIQYFETLSTVPEKNSYNHNDLISVLATTRRFKSTDSFEQILELINTKYPRYLPAFIEMVILTQTSTSNAFLFDKFIAPSFDDKSEKPLITLITNLPNAFDIIVTALSQAKQVDDGFLANILDLAQLKVYGDQKRKAYALLNLASIFIWRKCKFNHYCFQNQMIKDKLLNQFYHYTDGELTRILALLTANIDVSPSLLDDLDLVDDSDTQSKNSDHVSPNYPISQQITSIVTALSNVKTIQSLLLLTRTLQEILDIFKNFNIHLSNSNDLSFIILSTLKGLDTFPCTVIQMRNARQILESYKFYVPHLNNLNNVDSKKFGGPDNFMTLPLLNHILFKRSFDHLPKTAALLYGATAKILFRCDNSPMFMWDFTTHILPPTLDNLVNDAEFSIIHETIENYIRKQNYISGNDRITIENRKFYHIILTRLFPHRLFSRDTTKNERPFSINSFSNNFGPKLGFHIDTQIDQFGIPLQTGLSLNFDHQNLYDIEINTQNVADSISRLTSFTTYFFGSAKETETRPFVTISTSALAQPIELHDNQDLKERLEVLSNDAFYNKKIFPISPKVLISNDNDLSDIFFKGNKEESGKTLMDNNFMVQDMRAAFCLANGFPVQIDIMGVLHLNLHHKINVNLFEQSYASEIDIKSTFYSEIKTTVFNRDTSIVTKKSSLTPVNYGMTARHSLLTNGSLRLRPTIKHESSSYMSENFVNYFNQENLPSENSFQWGKCYMVHK